jgi:hypothetical protein
LVEIKMAAAAALCFCARSQQPPISTKHARAHFKHEVRTG